MNFLILIIKNIFLPLKIFYNTSNFAINMIEQFPIKSKKEIVFYSSKENHYIILSHISIRIKML